MHIHTEILVRTGCKDKIRVIQGINEELYRKRWESKIYADENYLFKTVGRRLRCKCCWTTTTLWKASSHGYCKVCIDTKNSSLYFLFSYSNLSHLRTNTHCILIWKIIIVSVIPYSSHKLQVINEINLFVLFKDADWKCNSWEPRKYGSSTFFSSETLYFAFKF